MKFSQNTTISIELPKFCINEKSFLKFSWLNERFGNSESKVQFFFKASLGLFSSITLKSFQTKIFLVKINLYYLTNVIKNISVCLKIETVLKFNSFFDFNYFSSSNLKLEGNLINFLRDTYIQTISNTVFKTNLDIPIDLIPTNFTRFNYFKSNFDLNSKTLNFEKSSKTYLDNLENIDQNLNPLGLDRRSIFSTSSDLKRYFSFKTTLIPKMPFTNFRKYTHQLPSFALGFLLRLYKHRPIWTKRYIDVYIPVSIKKHLPQIFPIIAYRFNGKNPFKDTWIRFGFDPRKSLGTRIYQTTGFCLKINEVNKSQSRLDRYQKHLKKYKKLNMVSKKKEFFKNTINKNVKKQVCDLNDFEYRKLLIRKSLIYINSQSGWFFK